MAARSPKEVADLAKTVMVSLPTPDIVLKVATGPDGVIEGKKGRRFVDLSTTGAVMAQRVFKLLAAKNIVQIDAPVSGGVRGAAKGTVAFPPLLDQSARSTSAGVQNVGASAVFAGSVYPNVQMAASLARRTAMARGGRGVHTRREHWPD